MYDPSIGRWLTPDPIVFEGGDVNLYRFVGNHPTNATDPSGLQEPPTRVIPLFRNQGRDPEGEEKEFLKNPNKIWEQFKPIKTTEEFVKFWESRGKKNLKYVVKADSTLIVFDDANKANHAMATAFPLGADGKPAGKFGDLIQAGGWVKYDERTKTLDIDIQTNHYKIIDESEEERRSAAWEALVEFNRLDNASGLFKAIYTHPENKGYDKGK